MTKYTNLEEQRWVISGDSLWMGDDRITLPEGTVIDPSARVYGAQFIEFGKDCYIGPGVFLRGHIKMGERVWIGPNCDISAEGNLIIEDDVGIGNSAVILTCLHPVHINREPISKQKLVKTDVVLKRGCNIGVNATILPGTIVGEGAQIGAGAVVRGTVPDYEIWVGNLATKIGER